MARRFLWIVTIIILLVVLGAFAFRLFTTELMRMALAPTVAFEEAKAPPGPDYRRADMWIARPDLPQDPASWLPGGFADRNTDNRTNPAPARASVFFIHPTSFLEKGRWNAPLDDADSQRRARLFVRSQASAFNGIGAIWAPKYRQATVGAFLSTRPDAARAFDFAYRDVRAAFDRFVAEAPPDGPLILAGHSQGSFHLARLLEDRVAGRPIARRIVAAYVVGWPLSETVDLPRLGLPACGYRWAVRCILAWQSFAEPAEPGQVMDLYDASMGPGGRSRAGTPILCVNPLTGTRGDSAPANANLGTLIPSGDLSEAELKPGLTPARCSADGLLLIGETPPEMPPYVLPGNNYHVFDYSLFWANIREDAARRLARFAAQ